MSSSLNERLVRDGFSPFVEKRTDRPFTYTDIFLGFHVPAPQNGTYTIQALSSNLISGHEVVAVASNLFYKHALGDTGASIESALIYKKTGNLTIEPTVGGALSVLSLVSCFIKLLPLPLILDVYVHSANRSTVIAELLLSV